MSKHRDIETRHRWIEIVRGAWSVALLTRPRSVLTRLHHVDADARSIAVARVLGTRHLVQAVLSGLRPGPNVLALGVWTDAVHASTALGLSAADRPRARAGLADATIAATWSAAGLRELIRGAPTSPTREPRREVLARSVLGRVPGGDVLLARARTARQRVRSAA